MYYNYKTELTTRNFASLSEPTGNIYEAVAIISKRSRQIAMQMKEELDSSLAQVTVAEIDVEATEADPDDIQEQIAISKTYERMPKPTIIALEEFLDDKLMYRYNDEDTEEGSPNSSA